MILSPPTTSIKRACIELPISKSLMARRLLLLSADKLPRYIPQDYPIDIHVLTKALEDLYRGGEVIDVHESGTAMRFMTAYIAVYPTSAKSITLRGTGRQHHRPIAPLVDALRELGANIEYLEQEGYPPLLIAPKRLTSRCIHLDASSSSQYLSALMLIAPLLEGQGYQIDTTAHPIASLPYAQMTLSCMADWGYHWEECSNGLFSFFGKDNECIVENLLEADWTAASYAYLWIVLGVAQELSLPRLFLPSLQGDSVLLPEIFEELGVQTRSTDGGIILTKCPVKYGGIDYNCYSCPDIVPTLVAACLALGKSFHFTGVAHLRIKESDRLEALRQETRKLGFVLTLESDAISWSSQDVAPPFPDPIVLKTYGDHRMAMALAPLFAQQLGSITIQASEVVSKSFPSYWQILRTLGYRLENPHRLFLDDSFRLK